MNNPEQITYFADTDARNKRVRFGIKAKDRTRHVYIIGKTGMGKSTILENMAAQDIQHGNGFAFIDPHGSAIDEIIQYVPKERVKDVLYFAPFDMENPISFNVMEDVGYDKRHLVVSGLMSTFKKIWVDAWSARMEYILGNTLLALLEYPNTTLLDVNKMLSDKNFRNKVVDYIKDPSVKSFWVEEFARYTERMAAEATPAIQNKIGQFTANPLIRNIIGQPKSSFDFRQLMDDRKIVLVNLSKGRIGESNAKLLGSMLITKIYLSAMSRADVSKTELANLPNFYLYVDEFQSFANESFADILSEARKYKLNLTIAHQYIEQMSDEVRAAVFGNVGTMITFRVGSYDAEVLEKEFYPTFEAQDIVNLGAYQIYLRLMIDGIGSQPFSARTIPPLETPDYNIVDQVIESSRNTYARSREEVEREMDERARQNSENSSNNNSSNGNNNKKGKPKKVINNKKLKEIDQVMLEKKKLIAKGPDAVEEVEEKDESVSLKDLSLKTQNGKNGGDSKNKNTNQNSNKNNQKGPSEKNTNSLKDALAGLGVFNQNKEEGSEEKKSESSSKKPSKEPQKETPKKTSDTENKSNTDNKTSGKVNEVSEKELRDILES